MDNQGIPKYSMPCFLGFGVKTNPNAKKPQAMGEC